MWIKVNFSNVYISLTWRNFYMSLRSAAVCSLLKMLYVAVIYNWLTQYLVYENKNVMKYQKSKKLNDRRQFTCEIVHIQLCLILIEIVSRLF